MEEQIIFGYIYMIQNMINQKQYIGLTTRTVEERFHEHIKADSYIGRAIRKHGINNFSLSIIDTAENYYELCQKEIDWIKRFDTYESGYNQTIGGDGVVQISYVENIYNEKQLKFLEMCENERYNKIDVHNAEQMIRSILIYLIETFLLAETDRDKKSTVELMLKLKEIYLISILKTGIITKNELKKWV